MRALLAALLIIVALSACETTNDVPSGIRLHLSQAQLYTITSQHPLPSDFGRILPLTPAQRQKVQAQSGKDIAEVWVINELPSGALAARGYNLALRDQAESIIILSAYAMNPAEVARKKASTPPLPALEPEDTMPLSAPAEVDSSTGLPHQPFQP